MNPPDPGRIGVAEGFYLSRIRQGDQAAYLEHFANREIARNTLTIPYPYTKAHADWWVEHCERQFREPAVRFGIRAPDGYLIGAIGIVGDTKVESHQAEIGYWLAASYRGRGLMASVLRVYADHAFRRLAVRRLYAAPFSFNLASARALQKAGFQREGLLREHFCKDGLYLDAIVYGLLASDVSINPTLPI